MKLRTDDPNLQWELARAWSHIADITGQIGSRDESLAAYERARSLFEQLVEADLTERKYAVGLAVVHTSIGLLHRSRGDLAAAFHSTRRSLEQAVACGFNDLGRLKGDPSLDSLRNRPDFRDLLEGLAIKRKSP